MLQLVRGLDRLRFEPTLVLFQNEENAGSYDSRDVVNCIRTLNIPAGCKLALSPIPRLTGAVRLARILQEIRADVLHTFLPIPAMIGSIAAHLTRLTVFYSGL